MLISNLTVFVGLGFIVLAILALAFSRYRQGLGFMFAGMAFWMGLELVRIAIQSVFEMSLLNGYLTAFMCFLAGMTVVLIIKDHRDAKRAELNKARCIEHTPVYEDDYPSYSA